MGCAILVLLNVLVGFALRHGLV